jgi:hypothetical protein
MVEKTQAGENRGPVVLHERQGKTHFSLATHRSRAVVLQVVSPLLFAVLSPALLAVEHDSNRSRNPAHGLVKLRAAIAGAAFEPRLREALG